MVCTPSFTNHNGIAVSHLPSLVLWSSHARTHTYIPSILSSPSFFPSEVRGMLSIYAMNHKCATRLSFNAEHFYLNTLEGTELNMNQVVSNFKHNELGSTLKSSSNGPLSPQASITSNNDLLYDVVDNVDYHYEAARLQSFENWPVPYIEPEKLAAAGFYYTGEGDTVRCFECQIEIREWVEGDVPMVDHQRWSPRCRFIRKINCGNIPIGADPNTIAPPRPRSRDVCGPYGVEYRTTSGPDNHNFSSELQLPSTAKLGYLGIGKSKGPVHPEYASYDARLRTFETWPKSMPQTKEQLADAGFYYTGQGDQTLCYHCGGGLKDWEPQDDPWEQHAKWFSKCFYLLMVQGQDYVNKITGQHISPPSIEETMQMNLPSFITKVQSVDPAEKDETTSDPGSSGSQDSGIESIGSCGEPANAVGEKLATKEASSSNSKSTDDARMCKICYNAELGVVFLPCGHMVACVKCAPGMTTCAVCRKPVSMTVRAFLS